ncbi:MAG TPA: NUDIX hydrolase [Candidatus Binatia bacterium]
MSPKSSSGSSWNGPREITFELPTIGFPPVSERAHGEVCMAIVRRSGRVLLQTKQSYPGSVMRLPSGGIQRGEKVERALLREIWEETNLTVSIERFVARIGYKAGEAHSRFFTHLFLVRELSGVLQSNDPDEKISDWQEALPEELPSFADKLRRVTPTWRSWGIFRAAAMDVLCEHAADLMHRS